VQRYFSGEYAGHYHPVTMMMYALEYKVFGLDPYYYHLVKLILHLVNTFLVFVIIFLLTSRIVITGITALFFAVSPVNVEAVAWISAQGTVLYSLFFLLSIFFYLYYIKNSNRIYILISFISFVISVLSKSSAIVLPVLLVIIDHYYRRKFTSQIFLKLIPYFAVSVIFGVIAMLSAKSFGSMNASYDFNITDRIFLACYSVIFYFSRSFVPYDLSAIHYYPEKINGFLPYEYYLAFFFIVIIIVLIIKSGKFRRHMVFGFLFFIVNLLLVIQFFPIGKTLVCERYNYLSCIGIFFITGQLLYAVNYEYRILSSIKVISVIIMMVLSVFYIMATRERNKVWSNGYTLYSDVIEKYPEQAYGYFGRAAAQMLENDPEPAINDFNMAINLEPDFTEAYDNRGLAKYHLKDYEGAVSDFNVAINQLDNYFKPYYHRGLARYKTENYKEAIRDFSSAISLNELHEEAYFYRGKAQKKTGKYQAALKDLLIASDINPYVGETYYEIAIIKMKTDDYKSAIEYYHLAIANNYDEYFVYYNLGNAAKQLKDYVSAIKNYDIALRKNPGFADAYNNRGIVKFFKGNIIGAIEDYSQAIKYNPGFADAYNNRAIAKYQTNDIRGACNDWEKAFALGYASAGESINRYCR